MTWSLSGPPSLGLVKCAGTEMRPTDRMRAHACCSVGSNLRTALCGLEAIREVDQPKGIQLLLPASPQHPSPVPARAGPTPSWWCLVRASHSFSDSC